ncbi:MAG: M20/M25/M40 family metallo-hydrolase [Candidatus Aenigmarchaeota archaeon]|nr:M20/M25/M40 family metallo-hydrolase [Candidatus Aenigmarchaeota archaeon]
MTSLDEAIAEMEPWFVDSLVGAVKIPSISSDPSRVDDVAKCSDYFRELLKEIGVSAEIVETKGHPTVLGNLITDDSAPVVMIYSHVDVQPVNMSDWTYNPFNAVADKEKKIIYGRGATDDKGPTLIGIAAAKKARELGSNVNIRFVLDGEEESGSPNFPEVIAARPDFFSGVDYLLLNDGMWASEDRPALIMGRRGLVCSRIELELADGSVHSGLAGGVAMNPLAELASLYAYCADYSTGNINIPGIYDGMEVLSDSELDKCLEDFDPENFLHELGLTSDNTRNMSRKEKIRHMWGMPTFEIHGMAGGHTSWSGFSTSIPGKACLYASMRTVPGQDPEQMLVSLKEHVRKFDSRIEVTALSLTPAYGIRQDEKGLDYLESAYEEGFGCRPVRVRGGGTESAAIYLKNATGKPPLPFTLSRPSEGYHKENEHFRYGQSFPGGVKTFLNFFSRVAQTHHA